MVLTAGIRLRCVASVLTVPILHNLILLAAIQCTVISSVAQQTPPKVLAFYSDNTEQDHVDFAKSAVKFLTELANTQHFTFEATTSWGDLNDDHLRTYQLVIWLNQGPTNAELRSAFERYMRRGGAWLGFHAAGYNDADTNWPWFVDFLGGAVFQINSWPPLPATIVVDSGAHPVMARIPGQFESPANEWYAWKPSPRLNPHVRVLATLDRSNYPIGLKDVVTRGDLPVIWTNTKYRMLYMNMGHGDKIFSSPIQNHVIENAVYWLTAGWAARTDVLYTSGSRATRHATVTSAHGVRVSSHAIAVNSRTGKFYAVNTAKGTLTVLDGNARFIRELKTGREPQAVSVNPDTNRVYVTNSGSGTVTVINGAADAVIANVAVGRLPYMITVNRSTNKVYVSRTFSNVTVIIDGETNIATTVDARVGDAVDAVALDQKTYLISYELPRVTVLDGSNNQISTIEASNHLWAVATNPVTKKVYAVSSGSNSVTVIDSQSHTTKLVNAAEAPCAIAVDSDSGRVFVVNYHSNSVTVIDGGDESVVATIGVISHPDAIAIDSGTHKVYVVSKQDGTTSILDGRNGSLLRILKTGKTPFAIAVNSKTHKAITLDLDGQVTVIDTPVP